MRLTLVKNGRVHACAEAVLCSVAASESEQLESVMLLGRDGKPAVPCGACRDLLASLPEMELVVAGSGGQQFASLSSARLLTPVLANN